MRETNSNFALQLVPKCHNEFISSPSQSTPSPSRLHALTHRNRSLDPVLAIASGIWAYSLYESRLQRPAGHSLQELIVRKYKNRQAKNAATLGEDAGLAEFNAELKKLENAK